MVLTTTYLDSTDAEIVLRDVKARSLPISTPQSLGVTLLAEEARDIACLAALTPHLNYLARQAEIAGWNPIEVVVGTLAWAAERGSDGT